MQKDRARLTAILLLLCCCGVDQQGADPNDALADAASFDAALSIDAAASNAFADASADGSVDGDSSPFSATGDPNSIATLAWGSDTPTIYTTPPCTNPGEYVMVSTTTKIVEQGEVRNAWICGFTATAASITRSDDTVQAIPLLSIPPIDEPLGSATAVVELMALPTDPLGIYTLSVDVSGQADPIEFLYLVDPPSYKRILQVPTMGPPGTLFDVYYVGFGLGATVQAELYREIGQGTPAHREYAHASSWTLVADQPLASPSNTGWTSTQIASAPGDEERFYLFAADYLQAFSVTRLEQMP